MTYIDNSINLDVSKSQKKYFENIYKMYWFLRIKAIKYTKRDRSSNTNIKIKLKKQVDLAVL